MSSSNICKFCTENQSIYVCIKCGASYCSLMCCRSCDHLENTEQFNKECIEEELNIQDSDDVCKKEMINIPKKVYGENDESGSEEFNNIRYRSINMHDPEQVWYSLTDSEKAEYEHDISKFVPHLHVYTPWWVENIFSSEDAHIPKFRILLQKAPSKYIKWNLINIITSYVFLNRFYNGKHRLYLSEFINGLYYLSKNLSINQNFDSYETAVKSVELCIQEHEMLKGFQEKFRPINDDLEILLSNGLETNCNYNLLVLLSDISNLMTAYKNAKKSFQSEQGEFSRRFPDEFPKASYSTHVDVKTVCLLLNKIEFFLSWVKE